MVLRFLLFLSALFCNTLFADETAVRKIRTLADRGQFAAVEAFCQEQFEQTELAEIDKIKLAAELVRSRSLQLLTLEPAQRSRLVKRLQTLESDWLTLPIDSAPPDLALAKIMLRLQFAMAERSLGNYQRLEADAAPATKQRDAFLEARHTLQNAVDRLKKCQQDLQSFRQRVPYNSNTSNGQNILALESSITMQRAIAQKFLALTFSVESDRQFELRRAAEMFSVLAASNSTIVAVQCKIEQAACLRLCGELEQCKEILAPLLNHPQIEPRLHAAAEWIRLLIAEGKIIEARQQFSADSPEARLFPEFNLARLELFLTSDTNRNVSPEHVAAIRLQETMERELGLYWGRRARLTVSTLSSHSTELVSAKMLATLAENQYRENRFAESAELYEQAATKADANRQADDIYRYHRLAAAAMEKALQQLPADVSKIEYQTRLVTLLRNISIQNPNQAESVQLHLSAIDLRRQIFAELPETLEDFAAIVEEHLTMWKNSPQTEQLRLLLTMLWERQGRLEEASAMLPMLEPQHWETLSPEIRRRYARKLAADGQTQEAVNILAVLIKQNREPATLQLLAEILSQQTSEKSLTYALDYWMQLERVVPKNSELWWSAREGIIDVLCKLGRQTEAEESFKMLKTLYPALGGAERKTRLLKRFGD